MASIYVLKRNADTSHDDARDWYDSYGDHISTEECGDLMIQAVDYDDLDGDDESVIAKLLDEHEGLTREEAEWLAERSREVRAAAEEVEARLEAAVAAYEDGDLLATVEAIEAARSYESDHGASPATDALASQLLEEFFGEVEAAGNEPAKRQSRSSRPPPAAESDAPQSSRRDRGLTGAPRVARESEETMYIKEVES